MDAAGEGYEASGLRMQADGGDTGKGGVAVLERPAKGGVDSWGSVMPSKSTKTGGDTGSNIGKSENVSTTDQNGLISPEADDINADIRGQAAVLTDEDGPLVNGPYIRNGKPYGRPAPTGKRKLALEVKVYDRCADSDFLHDPNTYDGLDWKPGQPRKGKVHFGHVPGKEYWRIFDEYKHRRITVDELRAFQYDPDNYQIESPKANQSHKYERR